MPQTSEARRLAQGLATVSQTTVLTIDDTQRAILAALSFTNISSTTPLTVSVWVVPAGQSVGTSYLFLSNESIGANQSYRETQLALVLEPGDSVIVQTIGGSASYFLSGALLFDN